MKIKKKIYCLTPVYNDWESFKILINNIENVQNILSDDFLISIIAINDGSTEDIFFEISEFKIDIKIINLKINIGHQRAIAVGLQYINNELTDNDYTVVLDGDGEDKPRYPFINQKMYRRKIFKNYFCTTK